jgi:hypothetical protein
MQLTSSRSKEGGNIFGQTQGQNQGEGRVRPAARGGGLQRKLEKL